MCSRHWGPGPRGVCLPYQRVFGARAILSLPKVSFPLWVLGCKSLVLIPSFKICVCVCISYLGFMLETVSLCVALTGIHYVDQARRKLTEIPFVSVSLALGLQADA